MIIILEILLISAIVYMVLRNIIADRWWKYWVTLIRDYRIFCIYHKTEPKIDYADVVKCNEFIWDIFEFNKDVMIKDKTKLAILKDFDSFSD